jgi:hypothetical protein
MILQQMTEAHPFSRWDERHQVRFDLIGIGVFREFKPL